MRRDRIGRRRNGNGRVRVPVVEAQPPERRRGRRNRAVAAPRNQDVGAIVGEVQVQAPLPLQIQAPPLPIERQPALQGPVAPAMNVQAPFAQVEIPAPVPMPNQNACLSNEIWIIGSSIICSARDHSENRPSGSNLGLLKNNNCFLRWAGKSGMKWDDVVGTVNSIINLCNKIPHALILHCGGNDIGNVPCGALLYHVKFTIAILSRMLPNCSLIWSSILPRRSWRYSSDDHAMEVTRKRINRGVRSYILKHGGYVIKYPDFDDRHPALYSDDGVHLSFIGNDIFLNQIQSALETFIKYPHCVVFPHDHL
ncbi:uncharacterized protein LOC134693232 isoform X3 [Mytilus trossulus]|uniref:uncharacterized protein LOC134693232 isoform X3 n=1 Tax=Mytilus trossulus TaxID=6551 RepID=UPI003005B22F